MDSDEFLKEMINIREEYEEDDEEVAHIKADELMCKLLIKLGYEKGIREFEEMKKWYA